ncbi:hypothetical protein [Aggregatilinea lenta]|uniref:hypothetical protein n=1 Tax=Aggregatilinea lenta TaxID=913108 RepID=UPI000E5A4F3F|nr:hypothetical protein [Aggregatilinea lenta]
MLLQSGGGRGKMMSYRTMVLIPDQQELTFSDLASKLQSRFVRMNDIDITLEGAHRLILHHGEWSLAVEWEAAPEVAVESADIARLFASEVADRAVIASCSTRITIAAQFDPTMRYFNDYVFVLEVLEAIPGLFLFDPEEGTIRKTA